ncbi:holo-[acyl-carrier-protein] synthase [Sphingomonadales bacterium EhC05]|nr:holo-[acyl-carrier-protein] synthase [Sphingomonadales bacterium EhC05]
MKLVHGIDLVEIASTERLLNEPKDHHLKRCFTPAEQLSAGTGFERAAKLSGRFAAKEAVMKALGTGFGNGIGFLDIEVTTLQSGQPQITLFREAEKLANSYGISSWIVSTSHEAGFAVASVIGLGHDHRDDV